MRCSERLFAPRWMPGRPARTRRVYRRRSAKSLCFREVSLLTGRAGHLRRQYDARNLTSRPELPTNARVKTPWRTVARRRRDTPSVLPICAGTGGRPRRDGSRRKRPGTFRRYRALGTSGAGSADSGECYALLGPDFLPDGGQAGGARLDHHPAEPARRRRPARSIRDFERGFIRAEVVPI